LQRSRRKRGCSWKSNRLPITGKILFQERGHRVQRQNPGLNTLPVSQTNNRNQRSAKNRTLSKGTSCLPQGSGRGMVSPKAFREERPVTTQVSQKTKLRREILPGYLEARGPAGGGKNHRRTNRFAPQGRIFPSATKGIEGAFKVVQEELNGQGKSRKEPEIGRESTRCNDWFDRGKRDVSTAMQKSWMRG